MMEKLTYPTTSGTDIVDITDDIQQLLSNWGLSQGACVVYCPGSTASISTIEYEPNTVRDIKKALDRIAPLDHYYHHEKTWHDGNGYSHVRATLMKPGITIPFVRGKLCLGTWQQVILMDFDNKPRNRTVIVQALKDA